MSHQDRRVCHRSQGGQLCVCDRLWNLSTDRNTGKVRCAKRPRDKFWAPGYQELQASTGNALGNSWHQKRNKWKSDRLVPKTLRCSASGSNKIPRNFKGLKNHCVHGQLGGIMDKKIQKDQKPNCHFWKATQKQVRNEVALPSPSKQASKQARETVICSSSLLINFYWLRKPRTLVSNKRGPKILSLSQLVLLPREHKCIKLTAREEPLEEGMATRSRTLAWRIPWTEEPGGLQSTGHRKSDTSEATEHTGARTRVESTEAHVSRCTARKNVKHLFMPVPATSFLFPTLLLIVTIQLQFMEIRLRRQVLQWSLFPSFLDSCPWTTHSIKSATFIWHPKSSCFISLSCFVILLAKKLRWEKNGFGVD